MYVGKERLRRHNKKAEKEGRTGRMFGTIRGELVCCFSGGTERGPNEVLLPQRLTHSGRPDTLLHRRLAEARPKLPFKTKSNDSWQQVRLWVLICWCFLTVGILLGSWWAYHELGWGGWWFWDPVENASLMPWLGATACLHSVSVPRLNSWSLFLNMATFVFSILGTFFVRSGLLASVHSFATDSTRGLVLLCFVMCITAISGRNWFIYINRSKRLLYKTQIEQILQLQNMFLCIICAVVLCGTAAPICFQWLFTRDVSTGAPFFNGTIVPLCGGVLLLLVYVHYAPLRYAPKATVCSEVGGHSSIEVATATRNKRTKSITAGPKTGR
jgi:cytochrome c biogenesis factor